MRDRTLRLTRAAVAALLVASSSACGVMLGGTRQSLDVQSAPTSATIRTTPFAGPFTTPASLNLLRRNSYVLELSKEGYSTARVEISRRLRPFAILGDLSVGVVVTLFRGVIFEGVSYETPVTLGLPLLVDFATGGAYRLVPGTVRVELDRVGEVEGPERIEVRLTVGDGRDGGRMTVESTVPGVTGRFSGR